ncbi:MAG: hypothetical protein ACYCYI_13230 [Saccharofermentanales bacterium]
MKYLSKINRGAILTAAVILAVITYLVMTSAIQKKEIPEIKKICEDYIQTEVKYNMLPALYRKDDPRMPKAELDTFLAKMKTDITAYYPPDERYFKYAIEKIANDLTSQSEGRSVVFQYTKTIAEYKDIIFDKNTVDVTILTNTTVEAKGLAGNLDTDKITQEVSDNIILQKTGGEWKVIYANLYRNSSNDIRGIKE